MSLTSTRHRSLLASSKEKPTWIVDKLREEKAKNWRSKERRTRRRREREKKQEKGWLCSASFNIKPLNLGFPSTDSIPLFRDNKPSPPHFSSVGFRMKIRKSFSSI